MRTYKLYGARNKEESIREKENRILARKVALEGMVLLKNEGILPLREKRIALYGAGARMTVKGGTGSGDTNERCSISIEQGLLEEGYQLPNTSWMDRFDTDYQAQKKAWRDGIEEKIVGYTMENVGKMFDIIHSIPFTFPIGDRIREEDLADGVETAVYVIARQAGEGKDRRYEPGDFLPSETELFNIRLLAETYKKFVLVLNCGGMMDLSPFDEIENIGAIVFYGQGGMEGGSAFAQLISGRAVPCGKLADTWARQYGDYPCAETFGHRNGELSEENYTEGIYVGYRYFDTFEKTPRYPFGYGLSYTDFAWEVKGFGTQGSKVWMEVSVTNTGNLYPGKEVMQMYVSKPSGMLDHEARSLAAFAKTPLLKPGERAVIRLEFDMRELASYDEAGSQWILESGKYGLYLGNSSRNNALAARVSLSGLVVTEKTMPVCRGNFAWKDLTPSKSGCELLHAGTQVPEEMMEPDIFDCKVHSYEKPRRISLETEYADREEGCNSGWMTRQQLTETCSAIEELLKEADIEQLAGMCVGGGQFSTTYHRTPGAVGVTSMCLFDKGIPNINFSDGPAGLNLEAKSVIEPDGTQKYLDSLPEGHRWGFLRQLEPYTLGDPDKGTPIYQYMTAWPAIHVQAQTWDVELEGEVGEAIGREMIETGVTLWLAPALNLHRSPLCGRNFEYYSEDPYLSGKMAAAVTKGVQSHGGIGVTMKHFCCNNQEDNRNYVSENVSERALRELYLRGFRYVVQEAHPWAVMSSYNRVNGVYTANSFDLLVRVLRCEWGYRGLVMSDWSSAGGDKASYAECPKAGNDLIMPGAADAVGALTEAVEKGRLTVEELKWCAANVLGTILKSRVVREEY